MTAKHLPEPERFLLDEAEKLKPAVSDFDLIHELAGRLGRMALYQSVPSWQLSIADAYATGGGVGVVAAVRAEMERERAGGAEIAERAFKRGASLERG